MFSQNFLRTILYLRTYLVLKYTIVRKNLCENLCRYLCTIGLDVFRPDQKLGPDQSYHTESEHTRPCSVCVLITILIISFLSVSGTIDILPKTSFTSDKMMKDGDGCSTTQFVKSLECVGRCVPVPKDKSVLNTPEWGDYLKGWKRTQAKKWRSEPGKVRNKSVQFLCLKDMSLKTYKIRVVESCKCKKTRKHRRRRLRRRNRRRGRKSRLNKSEHRIRNLNRKMRDYLSNNSLELV